MLEKYKKMYDRGVLTWTEIELEIGYDATVDLIGSYMSHVEASGGAKKYLLELGKRIQHRIDDPLLRELAMCISLLESEEGGDLQTSACMGGTHEMCMNNRCQCACHKSKV